MPSLFRRQPTDSAAGALAYGSLLLLGRAGGDHDRTPGVGHERLADAAGHDAGDQAPAARSDDDQVHVIGKAPKLVARIAEDAADLGGDIELGRLLLELLCAWERSCSNPSSYSGSAVGASPERIG